MSPIKEKGFTIIELLIASIIISMGLLSVVSMIIGTFSRTVPLSYNLTASYLAQEGFEVVRRIRDTNFNMKWQEGEEGDLSWLEGLMDESEWGEVKGSVYHDSTELGSNQEEYLKIDTDGFYNYDSGVDTTFKREITLSRHCYIGYSDNYESEESACEEGAEFILVKVSVTWSEAGNPNIREYEAKTKLFNWY